MNKTAGATQQSIPAIPAEAAYFKAHFKTLGSFCFVVSLFIM
jgi:hypothetical protein